MSILGDVASTAASTAPDLLSQSQGPGLLTRAAATTAANPLAALGKVQAVAKLGKGLYDVAQYRLGGQKKIDDRARAIAKDPSKAKVSEAEKRQMLGLAISQGSQLANIQDPAEYAQMQQQLRAEAGGDVQRIAQERMEDTYKDALKTVEKADEAKEQRVENLIGAGVDLGKAKIAKVAGYSEDAMEALYGSDPALAERIRQLEEEAEQRREAADAARSSATPAATP